MNIEEWIEDVEARAVERLHQPRRPRQLTIVYDPRCELCRRCRQWLLQQAAFLPLRFLACSESEARARFGNIPWLGDELVVVSDSGEVWAGPAAFLTCLWALREYREWSYRLAAPELAPLAERFFHALSARRARLSAFLGHDCQDGHCRS